MPIREPSQDPYIAYAHSHLGRPLSTWEPLGVHLAAVARTAADFAAAFGCASIAIVAGRLHDIGKCSEPFQAYIRQPEDPARRTRGPDHSTAGARVATDLFGSSPFGRFLALVIAGHHAGLADPDDLTRRLDPGQHAVADSAGWEAHVGSLPTSLKPTKPFPASRQTGFSSFFLIRMLFSCLVDADFLETERFMQDATVARGIVAEIPDLAAHLRRHMRKVRANAKPTKLNQLRAEILDHAVAKAGMEPGFFTLSVPTGGGKTLTSLAFALEHAVARGKRRIVYVIPFTAIIEQTASVFRDALDDQIAVLEHHASFDWERQARALDDDEGNDALGRLRRAAENWDAPIVVTTAVQFFESLFANRTSACRKLHNLANSVIILDEAQTLPLHVLRPCLAALDELARNYGATLVICTATQPAWRQQDGALLENPGRPIEKNFGLVIQGSRELAPSRDLHGDLKRVAVEVLDKPVDDHAIAARFAETRQMLCIVNSRAHARDVFALIKNQPGATHLTTLMCPIHRRQGLADLRTRLDNGEPVRLVATSLIEAGVDISFPEVWRAWAGLDSITQAAGRCNREGRLLPLLGRMVVFEPVGHPSPQQLRVFQAAARKIIRDHDDPLAPDAVAAYFKELYFAKGTEALDATMIGHRQGVLAAIEEGAGPDCRFPFRSIAESFHLIDDVMEPVVVPWDDEAEKLLARIAVTPRVLRDDLRQLQNYTVGIPKKARAKWLASGAIRPVRSDFGEALLRFRNLEHYKPRTGVDLSDPADREAEENIW